MRRRIALLLMLATLTPLAGCREGDGPADPSLTDARVYLKSVPAGAHITVDNRDTGQITPDTVALRRGDRTIELQLDSAGLIDLYADFDNYQAWTDREIPVVVLEPR